MTWYQWHLVQTFPLVLVLIHFQKYQLLSDAVRAKQPVHTDKQGHKKSKLYFGLFITSLVYSQIIKKQMCCQFRFRIMSWKFIFFSSSFCQKIWMSTYLPCRETISFYISNIIELPSLEQRTTTRTTTGYFWYVHDIYPGLQMYQNQYKQKIDFSLAADTEKSIYKNDKPNSPNKHIQFILFLG